MSKIGNIIKIREFANDNGKWFWTEMIGLITDSVATLNRDKCVIEIFQVFIDGTFIECYQISKAPNIEKYFEENNIQPLQKDELIDGMMLDMLIGLQLIQ